MIRAMKAALWLIAAAALNLGCEGAGVQRDSGVLEPYPGSPTVIVAGYVWDPEALQYSFGMCGPACSLRPIMMPGQVYFGRSLVGGAELQLAGLTVNSVSYQTSADDAGLWQISSVARAPDPLLYMLSWKATHGTPPDAGKTDGGTDGGPRDGGADGGADAGPPDAGPPDAGAPDAGEVDGGELDAGWTDAGSDAGRPVVDGGTGGADGGFDAGRTDAGTDGGKADGGDGGSAGPPPPFMGPIPQPTTYFPTLSINVPISPHLFQCVGRPAAVIGNTGILEAVAKYRTNTGSPTVPADFVDPAKFGGVIIWWAYASGGSTTRQGAGGTTITASAGQVVYVQWGCPTGPGVVCPPGPPVPPPGMASKSARNFYVMPGATSSNVGISVTLLPPAGLAPSVSFKVTDPVVDPTRNRPYQFAVLPQVTAVPGKIVFGELQALLPTIPEPAGYECVPE